MSYKTKAGIEIVDDDTVPEGELHIYAPMSGGGKIMYRFFLADHALVQEPAKLFLRNLDTEVGALVNMIAQFADHQGLAIAANAIRARIIDARKGEYENELPSWVADLKLPQ